FVRIWEACSAARCTPPSWATESSPYSENTRSYNFSARSTPTPAADSWAVARPRSAAPSPRNSSRNNRRRVLAVREYRANSAPFTTSGRFTTQKTGPSRSVKNGARASRSSEVNSSWTASSIGTDRTTGRGHASRQRGSVVVAWEQRADGGLDLLGRGPRVGRVANRPAHDEVVDSRAERRLGRDDALLIVLPVDRANPRRHDQEVV